MLHTDFLCNVFCCDSLLIYFSEPCSLTYLEVFIDILIYIDYFGLKDKQCYIHDFFGQASSMFSLFYLVCLVCLD